MSLRMYHHFSLWVMLLIGASLGLNAQGVGTLDLHFADRGRSDQSLSFSPEQNIQSLTRPDGQIWVSGSDSSGCYIYSYSEQGLKAEEFGTAGKVFIEEKATVQDLVNFTDGRVLLLIQDQWRDESTATLFCFRSNGQLDSTFGRNGRVLCDIEGFSLFRQIMVTPKGEIRLAGTVYEESWRSRDMVLLGLKNSGRLALKFGKSGVRVINCGPYDWFQQGQILRDGKILIAGHTRPKRFDQMSVVRLMADGTLDSKFGEGGIKRVHIGRQHDFLSGIFLQPSGKLVVVGHVRERGGRWGYSWVGFRLDSAGQEDMSFGRNGRLRMNWGGIDYVQAIAGQRDGQFVIAGTSNHETVAARFDEDGKLDEVFGEAGRFYLPRVPKARERVTDLDVQYDGSFIMSGWFANAAQIVKVRGNPFLPGLEALFAEVEQKTASAGEDAAMVKLSDDLRLRGALKYTFTPNEIGPLPPTYRGMFIREYAHITLGKKYGLMLVWDTQDRMHYYLNGKYLRSMQTTHVAKFATPNLAKVGRGLH